MDRPTLDEIDYATAMALPAGKTCAGCRSVSRCVGMGFTSADNTSCDFHPSRFRATLTEKPNDQ